MDKNENLAAASDLDSLSHGDADAGNMIYLSDLAWEHFELNSDDGSIVTNREHLPILEEAERFNGSLENKKILELGAYEGYYSLSLERKYNVAQVLAIEGNPRNFLKCCSVKNYFQLNKTKFLLGDCADYLKDCSEQYDVILATGILYHLFDPIIALENICRLTNVILIDTTYYHPDESLQAFKFTGNTKEIQIEGMEGAVLHERINPTSTLGKKHGMNTFAWMFDLPTLTRYLTVKGFDYKLTEQIEKSRPHRLRARLVAQKIEC